MTAAPEVRVRAMRAEDVDFATGLVHAAGWASESMDSFVSFLAHDPQGCFIAEAGAEKAGICIATRYGRSGFIGELVVSKHLRLLGIGQLLFQRALDYLLEAGVEVNVIRAWLGHVSLDTTNRYAEVNIRAKEAALQVCQPPIPGYSPGFPRRATWRDDQELLRWLDSL